MAGAASRQRALARFAALASLGRVNESRRALLRARALGLRRIEAEETALMLVAYGGFPAALEAGRVLQQAWPGRPRVGRERPPAQWSRRGAALCRRVYGPQYQRLLERVSSMHPVLARWMVEFGYGRMLSRPGLSARERERVTIAVLAALGWERQLLSHLLGARRLRLPDRAIRTAFQIGRRLGRSAAACNRAWLEFRRARI